MKRSIFYLICAVAVGGAACDKLPEAKSPSSDAKPEATPEATATPPPVGEQLEPRTMPPHPSTEEGKSPAGPNVPIYPGVGPGSSPSGQQLVPPHRKPPVAAKMEV